MAARCGLFLLLLFFCSWFCLGLLDFWVVSNARGGWICTYQPPSFLSFPPFLLSLLDSDFSARLGSAPLGTTRRASVGYRRSHVRPAPAFARAAQLRILLFLRFGLRLGLHFLSLGFLLRLLRLRLLQLRRHIWKEPDGRVGRAVERVVPPRVPARALPLRLRLRALRSRGAGGASTAACAFAAAGKASGRNGGRGGGRGGRGGGEGEEGCGESDGGEGEGG